MQSLKIMSKKQTRQTHASVLPFCEIRHPLFARIAILSWQNAIFTNLFEALILCVEYLQLISQALLINFVLLGTSAVSSSYSLENTLVLVAKIFNPGSFIDLEGQESSTFYWISGLFTGICLVKYGLFAYVITIAIRNIKGNKTLLRAWNLVFRTQSRVLYFFCTSFWTRVITISQNQADLDSNGKRIFLAWAVVIIVLEFLLAFTIEVYFSYRLPTKSFLAAKGNKIELITLVQKLLIQIFDISPISKTASTAWLFTSTNTAFCALRNYIFFQTLPYYKYRTLLASIILLMMVSCLSVTFSVQTLLISTNSDIATSSQFFVIIWIILLIFGITASLIYFNRIITKLITTGWKKDQYSPELLIHKIIFMKEVFRDTSKYVASKIITKYKWINLLSLSSVSILSTALNLNKETVADIDIESKESLNKVFILYLENIARQARNNAFLQLYFAFYYTKKLKLHGISMNILTILRESHPSLSTELNISLLVHDMQQTVVKECQNRNDQINLYVYARSIAKMTRLKDSMIDQAEQQNKLCSELVQSKPHLAKIHSSLQKVVQRRAKIKRQIKEVLAFIPDFYFEALTLCAHYQLILNHSIKKYFQLFKECNLKLQKYRQSLKSESLCQENIFQKENNLFVMMTRKDKIGTVTYCSPGLQRMIGNDATGHKGYGLAPPSMQKFYHKVLATALEAGESSILAKTIRNFVYDKEGHVVMCDLFINISPIFNQDLYFFAIVRPVPTQKEYLVVREDGIIETGSKQIHHELNLPRNSVHVSNISKKLGQASEACNMKVLPEKYKRELGETQEHLFSVFTSEGVNIALKSLRPGGRSYSYHCKIENQVYDDVLMKIIFLEKVEDIAEDSNKMSYEIVSQHLSKKEVTASPKSQVQSGPHDQFEDESCEDDGNYECDEPRHQRDINEKEKGWINFEKLESSPTRIDPEQQKDTLLSAKETEAGLLSNKTRKFMFNETQLPSEPNRKEENLDLIKDQIKEDKLRHEKDPTSGDEQHTGEQHVRMNMDNQSRTTQRSDTFTQLKITKVFREALKTKYTPKFFRVFLLAWYSLLVTLLIVQFYLNTIGITQIENFKIRKDVMKDYDTRSDSLYTVHIYSRGFWALGLTWPLNPINISINHVIEGLTNELNTLQTTNTDILDSATYFTDQVKEQFFAKDVRVFEASSSDYTQTTNFQAVDRIIEASYKGLGAFQTNPALSVSLFGLVLTNSLNDLQIKTYNLSDASLADATQRSQDTIAFLSFSIGLCATSIFIMLIFFIVMVYLQFKTETRHLLTLLRINHQRLELMENRINKFKKMAQNDENFEEISDSHISDYYYKDNLGINPHSSSRSKQVKSSYISRYSGVSRRFFSYVGQAILLLIVMTISTLINMITTEISLENYKDKISEISFATDLKLICELNLATLADLIIDPNTDVLILGQSITQALRNGISTLKDLTSQTPSKLGNGNSEYDSIITDILFSDACAFLNHSDQISCRSLQNGRTSGLIVALNDLQVWLSDTSLNPEVNDITVGIVRYNVMKGILDSILNILNSSFDRSNAGDVYLNELLNYVITCYLVLYSIGVHFSVIKPVGDTDCKFKRGLEAFSAKLILSNAALKSFLLESSRGALNAIKDEI